jgi:hypothetical protein
VSIAVSNHSRNLDAMKSIQAFDIGLQIAVHTCCALGALTATVESTITAVSNRVIYSPPSNAGWTDPRVLYARAVS